MPRGPFFGRDAELERVSMLLESIQTGGTALVLRGEPGVGKSTLLAAAVAAAEDRGMAVLTVAGVQAETHLPYLGLYELLRPAFDGGQSAEPARTAVLAAAGLAEGPVATSFRVALQVLGFLAARAVEQPVVLVVDDAQWLDRASWDVLSFVGRRLESEPVVLLVAMRDGAETDLRLAQAGLPELRVDVLSDDASAALLDHAVPGLPTLLRARVLAEAAGNPLGLLELPVEATRSGEGALLPAWLPLTTRLEQTFSARVAELPDVTRSLLLLAAVNDSSSVAEVVAAASHLHGERLTTDQLEAAVAARLVDVQEGFAVRFRHPLVRSAVQQTASVSRRQQAHAALAAVLGDDEDRRVWHRSAATTTPDEALARDLATAAARLRRRGAAATAVIALERAAQLSEDRSQQAVRLLEAVYAATHLGDQETLLRLLSSIDESALDPADQTRLAWINEVIHGGGWSGAARLPAFVEIVDRMRLAGDHNHAIESIAVIALRAFWSNPDLSTRQLLIDAAEKLDIDPFDSRLILVLGLVAPVERGAVVVERLARLLHAPAGDLQELQSLGSAASAVGAFAMSAVFLERALPGLRSEGRLGTLAEVLTSQAFTAARLGQPRLAITAATEAAVLAREVGQPLWALSADLARSYALALRGEVDEARAIAEACERALMAAGAHPMLSMVQATRGVAALASGRSAEAYAELLRIFDPDDLPHHLYERFSAVRDLVDAAVRSDRQDEVGSVVAEMEQIAVRTTIPVLDVALRYARAVLADDSSAEEHFQAALHRDLSAWPFDRARLLLAYSEWLRRRRRAAESRPHLRAACATFDALGTTPWAERARRELRASGETLRRVDDPTERLTPQELQIAQLAIEGLSNREIAERLYLSPRTVSTHLSRVYPKVGVTSRGELARVLATVS